MNYEPIIGMKVHAELLTQSKAFCRCSANFFGAEPNTLTCLVCTGMPGVLPVINRKAVDFDRAGVPLMEIVSQPDMRSADEAGRMQKMIRRTPGSFAPDYRKVKKMLGLE